MFSRFLQGKDTDRETVANLKAAIKEGREVTVRLLNYRKNGSPFWNMLTVASIRDVDGRPRFLVGVQVDVTAQPTVETAAPVGMKAANIVGDAMKRVDWVGVDPWTSFKTGPLPLKPHRRQDPRGIAVHKLNEREGKLKLRQFARQKQLGAGDVGMVDLVTMDGYEYAMKSLEKQEMIDRNKVGRVRTEEKILETLDHPFLATCYAQLKTDTHLHFLLEYCSGGELYALLNSMPGKRLPESWVKFYAVEVMLALQYLHLQGFFYRDLKPENILIHSSGHIKLTDYDLSYCQGETHPNLELASTSASISEVEDGVNSEAKRDRDLMLVLNPAGRANSFVGTEEYLAPEIISGSGHNAMVDWWSFGILLYELLYGFSPFRGSRRDGTFDNILKKPLRFPDVQFEISDEAKDLMKQLLHKDPNERLGHIAGADEVKRHPWFKGINWALVRNQEPPIIPGNKDAAAVANEVKNIEGF